MTLSMIMMKEYLYKFKNRKISNKISKKLFFRFKNQLSLSLSKKSQLELFLIILTNFQVLEKQCLELINN